jgi:non-homologous end joining protein Ku
LPPNAQAAPPPGFRCNSRRTHTRAGHHDLSWATYKREYGIATDEYARFEPEELKALEQASSSTVLIDSFAPEGTIDRVYFEDTYYLGSSKNGERGYRALV